MKARECHMALASLTDILPPDGDDADDQLADLAEIVVTAFLEHSATEEPSSAEAEGHVRGKQGHKTRGGAASVPETELRGRETHGT